MKRSTISDAGLAVTESSPGVYVLTPKLQPPEDDGRLYAWRGEGWEPIQDNAVGEPTNDGKAYVRQSGAWVPAPVVRVAEAPEDGREYVRGGGKWLPLAEPGIADAPADGKSYLRLAGRWIPAPDPKPMPPAVPVQAEQKVEAPGTTLRSDVDTLQVHTTGNIVVFDPKTPAVAPGIRAGQILILCGAAGTLTLQGVSEYAHAGIVLGAATRSISLGVWLTLIWTGSVWLEIGYLKQP